MNVVVLVTNRFTIQLLQKGLAMGPDHNVIGRGILTDGITLSIRYLQYLLNRYRSSYPIVIQ